MSTPSYMLRNTVRKPYAPPSLTSDANSFDRFLAHCHRRRYPSRSDVFRPGDAANTM